MLCNTKASDVRAIPWSRFDMKIEPLETLSTRSLFPAAQVSTMFSVLVCVSVLHWRTKYCVMISRWCLLVSLLAPFLLRENDAFCLVAQPRWRDRSNYPSTKRNTRRIQHQHLVDVARSTCKDKSSARRRYQAHSSDVRADFRCSSTLEHRHPVWKNGPSGCDWGGLCSCACCCFPFDTSICDISSATGIDRPHYSEMLPKLMLLYGPFVVFFLYCNNLFRRRNITGVKKTSQ